MNDVTFFFTCTWCV